MGSRPHPAWTAAALLSLWILTSLLAYRSWIHGADHRDFYARWTGARLLLFEGRDLYSLGTTRMIQMRIFGTLLPPEADQWGFAYPALIVGPLLPFWLIGDVEVSTAIWVGFSAAALVGSLMLLRRLVGPPPPPAVIALFLAWSYTLLMLYQGQFTGFVGAAITIGIWGSWTRRERLGGLVASLALIKPALSFLPLAALCYLAIRERRHGFISGLAIGTGLLFALSVVIAGWWIPGWIEALGAYSAYAKVSWPIRDAWQAGPLMFAVLAAAVVAVALALRRASMLDRVGASIPFGIILLPQTLIWELSILGLPLLIAWRGRGRAAVVVAWALGWLGLLPTGGHEWWKPETAVMALAALLALLIAGRSPSAVASDPQEPRPRPRGPASASPFS
jgi:hypothetical protein